MSSAGIESLTAEEVRSLRRRITAMRVALAFDLVITIACWIALGDWGPILWMAPVVPCVILCFVLYVRASRCPRCRKSVWSNPPPDEDGNPGFTLFGQFHPDNCRACGVRLSASARG